MSRNILVKLILFPFSLLYGLVISVRNLLYSQELLRSVKFNIPVVGIGNLSIGGAGKTPHVEYLIRLLQPFLEIGTMSRGYNRKTKGYRLISQYDTSLTAGDEPMQYFLKFPEIKVAVSESRSIGIPQLLSKHPEIQVILLDDSYQHRSVTPSLNILLTQYASPYSEDYILPVGRLREWASGADRADIVVVTKCPTEFNRENAGDIESRLSLLTHQHLFFTRYRYLPLYDLMTGFKRNINQIEEAVLICAIASEDYLMDYLLDNIQAIHPMIYEDHHYFNAHELSLLQIQYNNIDTPNKAIITTEKDATRLALHKDFIHANQLNILVLPVEVEFLFDDQSRFDEMLRHSLMTFKT